MATLRDPFGELLDQAPRTSRDILGDANRALQHFSPSNINDMLVLCLVGILTAAAVVFGARSLSDPRQQRKPPVTEPRPRGDAGTQVSGTFELLENILLRLRMGDILVAQAVSKQFKQVIENSLPLQRAVFLEPASSVPGQRDTTQATLNPLLFPRFGIICGNHDEEFLKLCINDSVRLQLKHEGGLTAKLPEASWRRMYLTQPPCKIEFGVEEQEGRPAITILSGPTVEDVIVESRRRLAYHVNAEDLPRIRQRDAALRRG
ncbi:hypothetical protein LTR85_009768 [Meristemomyces frigidus]|nr:hypothetical protein LTR85_009768 [Meristemomyces frigidus]